jgi:hypothetical protein
MGLSFAIVLSQIDEVEDIGVPWLDVGAINSISFFLVTLGGMGAAPYAARHRSHLEAHSSQ